MSRLVSGNMVSLRLADFGAEVIKIEDPKRGDPLPAWQTGGSACIGMAMSLHGARGRELFLEPSGCVTRHYYSASVRKF
jgi:crotonobetainyl-CoA:carnitine CoA-transferase CaiB-like acyl-CoA transferase